MPNSDFQDLTPDKCIAVMGAGYWGKNLVRNFHALGALAAVRPGVAGPVYFTKLPGCAFKAAAISWLLG